MKIEEIWKSVVDYEDLYEVSNLGNLRSKTAIKKVGNQYGAKSFKTFIGVNKKPTLANTGYYTVDLFKNNKRKTCLVHRLVAEAFIPNPNYLPVVNHKDGNKLNNYVDNLEWCTQKENMVHAFNVLGIRTGPRQRLGKNNKLSKRVIQLSKDYETLKIWDSISDVKRDLNINTSSICACLKGKYHTAGGYIWRYYEG